MGLLSKAKQNSAANTDAKPAATFWDDPAPAQSSGKHSKVEEARNAVGDPAIQFDASLELQTEIRGDSRSYLQQSMNASATNSNVPPTRPAAAMQTKAEMLAGDNRLLFSTHRAALGMLNGPNEQERLNLVERAERKAWSSFAAMLELFAR